MDVALIVQTITGYLDLKSLLQVRLVNNLWNENAKLNIKKHYISLKTDQKISKMMEMMTHCFPLQKFDIFGDLRNLKNLIRKFGKSFKAYRFKESNSNFASVEITEALMDILRNSPHLQILGFYSDFTRHVFLAKTTEVNCVLPKLNSFTFEYGRYQVRDQETIFLKKMLDASPSLQYLKIKNISVELSSLIAVVANRNIKAVHLAENSSSGNSFYLNLASASVNLLSSGHITKLNKFLQIYSHTMRHLKINEIMEINGMDKIPTMKYLETLKLEGFDKVDKSRNIFYEGQFPSLKRLRLGFFDTQRSLNFYMNSMLPFPNLNHLELIFYNGGSYESDRLPASIELSLDLPLLEILRVQSHYVRNITFPKKVNLRKLIMHNGFEFEQLHLQFPNLKVLHILINFGNKAEDLEKVFQNLPGLEKLTIELGNTGTLWKIFTGLSRGDKDLMKKVFDMIKSNMTSLAQGLLNESKPNLGNLIALRSLTVQGGDHMDASIAIAFLVFCGKLKNLTQLNISLLDPSQRYFELVFGYILSSNNTCYEFLPGSEDFRSKYHGRCCI